MPPHPLDPADVVDYQQQMILSLSSARQNAVACVRKAQQKYKTAYDRKVSVQTYHIGDWVMVRFPADEVGKQRKLSRSWHGPYRVTSVKNPDVVVTKVYFLREPLINVHQLRVTPCPVEFPAGYYWYGQQQRSSGRVPQWLERLATDDNTCALRSEDVGSDDLTADDIVDTDQRETTSDHDSETAEVSATEPVNQGTVTNDCKVNPRKNTRYSLRTKVKPLSRFQDVARDELS